MRLNLPNSSLPDPGQSSQTVLFTAFLELPKDRNLSLVAGHYQLPADVVRDPASSAKCSHLPESIYCKTSLE
jgi:hypothetical protein